jgi:hypothetical protein
LEVGGLTLEVGGLRLEEEAGGGTVRRKLELEAEV